MRFTISDLPGVLIIGGSARAAAWSVQRAGWRPYSIDRFADEDVAGTCIGTDGSRDQIIAEADRLPPGPWLYTGGLENQPSLVAAVSRQRRLLGNPAEVLVAVRDVQQLRAAVMRGGYRFPRSVFADEQELDKDAAHDGQWLRKPYDSCGGLQIVAMKGRQSCPVVPEQPSAPRSYWQQRIRGLNLGAIYVAGHAGCRLLGVTEQLRRVPETAAPGFHYAGSMGPLFSDTVPMAKLVRLGALLAERFALRGLFGVDAILAGAELWVLEVNPRYTASVEILERAFAVSAMRLHFAACEGRPYDDPLPAAALRHGKAIVYAKRDLPDVDPIRRLAASWNRQSPLSRLADIPAAHTMIVKRSPVITVFAAGATRRAVMRGLRRRLRQVRQRLGDTPG